MILDGYELGSGSSLGLLGGGGKLSVGAWTNAQIRAIEPRTTGKALRRGTGRNEGTLLGKPLFFKWKPKETRDAGRTKLLAGIDNTQAKRLKAQWHSLASEESACG